MMSDSTDFRSEICKSLGLADVAEAYEIIVAGAKKGVEGLLERGLNAKTLIKLGYYASGMEKIGYTRPAWNVLDIMNLDWKRRSLLLNKRELVCRMSNN